MAQFSKRHYQAIAQTMQRAWQYCETENQRFGVQRAYGEMSELFAADNPLFNKALFLQACQPGANVRAQKVA